MGKNFSNFHNFKQNMNFLLHVTTQEKDGKAYSNHTYTISKWCSWKQLMVLGYLQAKVCIK
jgi:hypothetical protein